MELNPIDKRVIGLDVHQAQITACAIILEKAVKPAEMQNRSTFMGIFWRSRFHP